MYDDRKMKHKGSILEMAADLDVMDEDEFDKVIDREKARVKAEKRNQRASMLQKSRSQSRDTSNQFIKVEPNEDEQN